MDAVVRFQAALGLNYKVISSDKRASHGRIDSTLYYV
jgi:hypothetical protein